MKKFTFRLQIVLDRALRDEEAMQLQLARVQEERVLKEREIAHKDADRREMMAHMTRLQQATFDPRDMHQCYLHLEALNHDLLELRMEAEELDQRVLAARQALAEAMRKRQLLEKLREKQHAAYRKEAERQELQTMEESALPRLAREHAAEQRRQEQGE